MEVFTDGACSGNPGPGGWGWVTRNGPHGSGGAAQTTNQRMELQAVLEALKALDGPIEIYSDSTYVVNCFNDKWYEGWLKRGWRNSAKKPVANRDIWEPLIELYLDRAHEIEFHWVKGHSGNEMNERADVLAVAASTVEKEALADAAKGGLDEIEPEWPAGRGVWAVGATDLDDDQQQAVTQLVAGLDPGSDVLVSGLRRGTELMAAERALARGVSLAAVLPFDDPAAGWAVDERARFESALRRAQWSVILPGDRAQPGKAVEARNRWIAEHVVGALVVGDPRLASRLDEAGLTVLTG
ncbi:MAG: ribonuclease HI [Acidimicrobiales bacterium]|jgi:ribonuclease HI